MKPIEKLIEEMLEKGEQVNIATVFNRMIDTQLAELQQESQKNLKDIRGTQNKIETNTKGEDVLQALHQDILDLYMANLSSHAIASCLLLVKEHFNHIHKYLEH